MRAETRKPRKPASSAANARREQLPVDGSRSALLSPRKRLFNYPPTEASGLLSTTHTMPATTHRSRPALSMHVDSRASHTWPPWPVMSSHARRHQQPSDKRRPQEPQLARSCDHGQHQGSLGEIGPATRVHPYRVRRCERASSCEQASLPCLAKGLRGQLKACFLHVRLAL